MGVHLEKSFRDFGKEISEEMKNDLGKKLDFAQRVADWGRAANALHGHIGAQLSYCQALADENSSSMLEQNILKDSANVSEFEHL